MSVAAPSGRHGFTLLELLVAIGIFLILSALSFGALRASRSHQALDQAALQISLAFDYAKALAQSEGESVYFVIADHEALPAGAPMRAWNLLRRLDAPQEVRDWTPLPRDAVFAPDPSESGPGDLLAEEPLSRLTFSLPAGPEDSLVYGPVRVLVEITAEGRFVTAGNPAPTRLVLRRAEWFKDAASTWMLDFSKSGEEMDAVRLRLRPLTGVVVQERVEP